MQIPKNGFVVTLKTQDEVVEFFDRHIPEEKRLLWLGFFICNNHIASRMEQEGLEIVKKK
jgi:hypothetical protein